MAHDKSYFILYADQAEVFINLPDDIAGKLIKIIFDYVNDKNPEVEDLLLKVAFAPIKQQLKRDLKDWENVKSNRSTAGKKGMASRWGNKAITKDNAVIPAITNITVNDNVNVNVNNIEERKASFANSLKPYLSLYGPDMLNEFYAYWTEHGENDKKFRSEKEKSFSTERRLETWKRNEIKFGNKPQKIDKL